MDSPFAPMIGMFVVLIAIMAAKRKAKQEEAMATYQSDDLNGWEFKILRSETGRFKNRGIIQKICQDEARAGWEMVEKFDNHRIRFKRRVEKRSSDQLLDFDPYRTKIGLKIKPQLIAAICLVLFGIAVAVYYGLRP